MLTPRLIFALPVVSATTLAPCGLLATLRPASKALVLVPAQGDTSRAGV